jgi:carboxymethylenebutenolidase
MSNLTPDRQPLLATWQQHTYAEFVLKDADAALATMTENPYVLMISSGTARVGRAAVREFYADHFLPQIPPDLEITSLSQTFGDDRLVEEMVIRFTHSMEMDWILPGLRPTQRTAEFLLAGVIRFEGGKVAHEHLYWDQATLLSQMGVLDHPLAAGGVDSAQQLLRLR